MTASSLTRNTTYLNFNRKINCLTKCNWIFNYRGLRSLKCYLFGESTGNFRNLRMNFLVMIFDWRTFLNFNGGNPIIYHKFHEYKNIPTPVPILSPLQAMFRFSSDHACHERHDLDARDICIAARANHLGT